MQRAYSQNKYSVCSSQEISIQDFIATVVSVFGGIILIILCAHLLQSEISGWSPTETAKRCFSYPEEPFIPDNHEIGQILLSAAFFGSDAIYFDDGDENTGIPEYQSVKPSESLSEALPDPPLGESHNNYSQDNIYEYDRSILKEGEIALLPCDISGGAAAGEVLFSNNTSYTIDSHEYLSKDYPIDTVISDYSTDKPLILIIHTHGTESYAPEGKRSLLPSDVARSSDSAKNMISVGKTMADLLNEAGIPTLHCEIMHDLESYNRSYNLAADTIQRYLSEYPSIQYVFDVHRDAIVKTNGDLVRPITLINGEIAAQIMLLVGTNEQGADHPNWETNFTVAAKLQKKLTTDYNNFARPINIRGASFNEQFTPGSLLIEVGSSGNSLQEAKTAAKYLTYAIIEMITENQQLP